ncbi:hypothetical protein AHF37_05802 [Paragonimus kellicotti]|nr:hypothetical protein AHF37_05802 [Paragonimus kellicotti]
MTHSEQTSFDYTMLDTNAYYTNSDSLNAYSAGMAPGTTTGEPKFSMTANVLCVTLVAFYEDEPVLGTDATIPTHAQSDLCKSVGPASRRTNVPSGRTCSRIEPNNSSAVNESEEDSALDSSSCPVGNFDRHPTHSDTPTPVATEARESFTVQTLAALPGPFLFFSRFSGLLPWRSPAEFHNGPNNTPTARPKHNRSTTSLFDTADTAKPMCIDRSAIDTGKMSPAGWVAHLRRQFAELASPRDHLCLVGGLWHVELCSHLVTTRASLSYDCCPSARLQADRRNRTQVDFSAQLFGVEVSECLFPDESVPDLSSTAGVTIVELLSFPDRSTNPGDRMFRTTSSEATAVQCSGLLSYVDSVDANSQTTAPIAGTVSNHSLQIDLAYCRVEMDLSLSDRVHRITDAIVAASEAVTKFLPLNLLNSVNGMPWWRDEEKKEPTSTRHVAFAGFSRNLEEGISFQPPRRSHHVGASSLKQPFSFLEPTGSKPTICTTCGHPALAGSLDLNLFCVGLEVVLRFPIPLEAVKVTAPQNLSDLRTKLWNTGIPLWIDKPDSISGTPDLLLSDPDVSSSTRVGLAWWRRTLRPEYLRIVLAKLTFGYRTPRIAAIAADDPLNKPTPSHAMRRSVGGEIPDIRSGVYSDRRTANVIDVGQDVKDSEPQLKVTLRLLTVYVVNDLSKLQSSPFLQLTAQNTTSDLITVSVHLAPLGRQELVEQQPDVATKLDDLSETPPVFSFSHERFQMGIDLASLDNSVKHVGPSASFGGPSSGRPVEWSLWRRTGPKQNPRTPFVIRRSFLQDAPKAHAKQTTYYPGDVNHMAFYRRSASVNTRYAVLCRITTAVIHVDNKQTMDVVYLRICGRLHFLLYILGYALLNQNSQKCKHVKLRVTVSFIDQSSLSC